MQEGLRGDLATWPLAEILGMLTRGSQTGRLDLIDGARVGSISVLNGAIQDVHDTKLEGEQALVSLATWAGGNFAFSAGPQPVRNGRAKPLDQSLLGSLGAIAAEARELRKGIPVGARPVMASGKPTESVTLEPFDWRIIASLRSVTDLDELRDAVECDDLTLLRAVRRLMAAGLLEMATETSAPIRMSQAAVSEPEAASPVQQAPERFMAPSFGQRLLETATEFLGPITKIIIEDETHAMDIQPERVPVARSSELVERIAREIRNPDTRANFMQQMLAELRVASQPATTAAAAVVQDSSATREMRPLRRPA